MKIALLGDIALIGKYDLTNGAEAFANTEVLRNAVIDCDFVIANLESPLTMIRKTRVCKGVYLRSNPENVGLLKYIGITHVTLANNHTFDYGVAGAKETIEVLERAGIEYVGINGKPAVLRNGSDRVQLEGFCCYSANATHYGERGLSTSVLTPGRLDAFLSDSERKGCLPIASVHFGIEGVHYPSLEHRKLFEQMASEYTYVLHGNHPHAVQGMKNSGGSLLCYALGNTCFDDCYETSIGAPSIQGLEEHKSVVVRLDIRGSEIESIETIGLSDSTDTGLMIDDAVRSEVDGYSAALLKSPEWVDELRSDELLALGKSREKRTASFYAKRMNPKYIGAYRAGIAHSHEYLRVMAPYLEECDE